MGHNPAKTKETLQRISQLATFNEIGKAITSSLDLKEILNIVMEKISELFHPGNWSLLLVSEDGEELTFEIAVGEGSEKLKDMRLKIGEGVAGWVAREKKPIFVPDVSKDKRYCKKVDGITNFKTHSIICLPLVTRGKCLGVIELLNRVEGEAFGEEDMLLLTTIADYTAIAIENAAFLKRVHELSIKDDLTKLFNPRYLHSRLESEVERARRFKYDLSMLFIDLDYFKNINDNYGHLCGSKLLTEVARLLEASVRSIDMAFRYGGDEFIIVMPETSKENALLVAEKLRRVIKDAVFLTEEGINCKLTASFGVASYPVDAKDKNDLIHLADNAMYKVKNKNRDGVAGA